MKSLLIAALTLAAAPSFAATVVLKNAASPATASVRVKFAISAAGTTTYAKESAKSYAAKSTRAIATGNMVMTVEGQTQSKSIPPQNSTSEAKGTLKILSNEQVELNNDGGSAKMAATIVRAEDGSIQSLTVSDKEMVKAINTIIASSQGDQIRALQDNPALIKASIELSAMKCKGTSEGLSCDQSMKISMEMAQ